MDTTVCPVCTLYLRNNITLENHLRTHPKNKVIEALISLSTKNVAIREPPPNPQLPPQAAVQNTFTPAPNTYTAAPPWQQSPNNNSFLLPVQTNNSSIIYQQFVSSNTTTTNCMPTMAPNMVPQYITIPTNGGFNQQLIMNQQPYVYQHQQQMQLMSTPIVPVGYTPSNYCQQPIIAPRTVVLAKPTEPVVINPPNRQPVIQKPPESIQQYRTPPPVVHIDLINKPPPKQTIISQSTPILANQTDRSPEIISMNKKPNTPPVSVSTIQLADITISTEVIQKDTQLNTECNSNQMEIIPIYNKKSQEAQSMDRIDLTTDEEKMESMTSQDIIEESKLHEIVNKKTVIEVYSNENTRFSSDERITDEIQLYEDDEPIVETEKEEIPEEDKDDFMVIGNFDEKQKDEKSEYILPEVTFYQIPKFEDVSDKKQQEHQEMKSQQPESKNDIVIIQNEVICSPIKTSGMFSSLADDDACFKVEHNDLESNYLEGDVVEFDDIKLMLNNNLITHVTAVSTSGTTGTVLTAVNDLHCTEDIYDDDKSSPILLNIGEMITSSKQQDDGGFHRQHEDVVELVDGRNENYSRDSLNIRADECMPPKGELSEQESNGAGDEEAWGKIFQEGSSGISTSYDLIARESWEASDSSDSEITPPLQSRIPPTDTQNTSSSSSSSSKSQGTKKYKCVFCKEIFFCPKERRVHQTQVHAGARKTTDDDDAEEDKSNVKVEASEEIESFTKVFENENGLDSKLNVTPDSKQKYCDICKLEFKTSRRFAEHHRSEHTETPLPRYKCSACQVTFAVECKFTEHLKIHPLMCSICYKLFYKRQNLKNHLKRHLIDQSVPKQTVKKYKCDVCNKLFFSYNQKLEHMNIHTGSTTYKCKLCSESFRRRTSLIHHRDTVHHLVKKKTTREFVCHCGETFKSKNRYKWHSEIHDSKPKACMHCSEKFIHASSLTRHVRIAHDENYMPVERKPSDNVPCPVCKKMYIKNSLDAHIKIHTGVRPFGCHICNRVFTTKWNLQLHKWTHAARISKPFKCTLCQGAFVRKTDFVSHMNSHRNIKPYTCNHCGRQFIRKYNCQRHVREHERDKSFKCTVCSKEFHRSYYLQEHLRVHSGDRPYSCHICGKTSTTKSNHNKHMRIHHARDPVSTEN